MTQNPAKKIDFSEEDVIVTKEKVELQRETVEIIQMKKPGPKDNPVRITDRAGNVDIPKVKLNKNKDSGGAPDTITWINKSGCDIEITFPKGSPFTQSEYDLANKDRVTPVLSDDTSPGEYKYDVTGPDGCNDPSVEIDN